MLVVGVVLVAAACASGSAETVPSTRIPLPPVPSSTTTTSGPPDGFGGEIRIGIPGELTSLNPFSDDFFGDGAVAGKAVWATVYDIDPVTWEKIPDLVTSLPTQSSGAMIDNGDGTVTVQYQIVPRATWSDGVPITGADLAFTAEAMRDLALRGNPRVDPIMATVVDTDSVGQVAWVTFAHPTLAIEEALWIVLPAHALADVDLGDSNGVSWPSGGPFMVRDGDPTSMTRNPNYWKTDDAGRQLPFADSLTFVSVGTDDGTQFEAGDVDIVEVMDDAAAQAASALPGTAVESVSTPFVEQLTFNLLTSQVGSVNRSAAFREAVAHAIDRSALLESAQLLWDPATPGVLIPKGSSAWAEYTHNTSAARSLISSLQLTSAPRSVLATTATDQARLGIANGIEAALVSVGVSTGTEFLDPVQFYGDTLVNGVFDVGMWAWENDGGYAQTLAMLERFDPANAPTSFSGWGIGSNASTAAQRFSELVVAAHSTMDPQTFATAVREAESILASELPLIPLFHRASHLAVRTDRITGVIHNATSSGFTWNVESWQVVGQ